MELDKIINEIVLNNPELAGYYQNNEEEIKTLIDKLHIKKEDVKDLIKLYKIIEETDILCL
ncbi:hypothetical protein [Desulfotruncus alcoholivorax]|uniref:hypothetical protein n=1 Tax=Desulfotruncus alcoholivorax TaxID=265477 RepID=UPI00041B1439|nr:hypothetical protein [Desulfotruncus alcoholivorax]